MSTSLRTRRSRASPCRCPHEDCHSTLLQIFVSPCGGCYRKTVSVILRGCEEILSGVGPRGGSEGSSVAPAGLSPIAQTVRLVAQRGRWFLRRSVGNVDPV